MNTDSPGTGLNVNSPPTGRRRHDTDGVFAPYNRQLEFNRRQQIHIGELVTWIVSKEDLILSKLSWAQDSRSELQLNDVRNLLATEPDLDYLREWSSRLNLDLLLKECLNE